MSKRSKLPTHSRSEIMNKNTKSSKQSSNSRVLAREFLINYDLCGRFARGESVNFQDILESFYKYIKDNNG